MSFGSSNKSIGKAGARIIDGFRGVPNGMDGSKDPILTPKTALYYAQNVTFRGGSGPKTRPGFKYRNFFAGGLFQGWAVHHSVLAGVNSVILAVVGGRVLEYNPAMDTVADLSVSGYTMSATKPVYFCQASRFTIIQDGQSEPLIYAIEDQTKKLYTRAEIGNSAILAAPLTSNSNYGTEKIPIGTFMAYGQGRLFVAVKEENSVPSAIWAGDISFGGSTDKKEILTSATSGATKQIFTVKNTHNYVVGDYVTVEAHNTLKPINGTYEIIEVNAAKTTFTVYADAGTDGTSGFASVFNAGKDTDIFHFTEHHYINEGGALIIPAELGRIKALTFLPVQDTTAGQGDLVAFCDRGAASFAVSLERSKWKETQSFQKVLFMNIGLVGESVCPVNGDLFFRSMDGNGIRSYRNARAEFTGTGQTPLSAEIDPILMRDTEFLLEKTLKSQSPAQLSAGVSLIYFDNRLLMTCLPKVQTFAAPSTRNPFVYFTGIVALDFQSVSANNGKSSAAYDGVWTGINVLSLAAGNFDGNRRAFAACYHNDRMEIWEITKDLEYDRSSSSGQSNIVCSVTTRNYDFDDPAMLKKLLRCDLWFDSISGGPVAALDIELFYRPDSSPKYVPWATWQKCFTTQYTNPTPALELITPYAKGYAPQLRSPTPPQTANSITGWPDNIGYDFGVKVKWIGQGRLSRLMLHCLETVENVGGG